MLAALSCRGGREPPHPFWSYQPSSLRIAVVSKPEIRPERMLTAKSFILSLNAVGFCLRRLAFSAYIGKFRSSFCFEKLERACFRRNRITETRIQKFWDTCENRGIERKIAQEMNPERFRFGARDGTRTHTA